ncbi:spore coat protein, CotS family [Carboxydocella sporoproducens DSM 16521]|uniref:Spore coat protein, CotS family n=2 Tax=Carboxydocella TaxID=178898 RepID=A0A1T4RNP2_9FIRM|nr:CotS family spore coat protein [Carboxydocella thermautotrophica]AVX20435.1 spore coat protein, CotS family [Carboxydocella thermautotrophica]SKA17635.1 spore coat protein, CotS family [Carboxydocella sporoproducens DSM 16521]
MGGLPVIPEYVIQAYGFKVTRVEKIRRIWRCHTERHGIWGIKWVEYPPEEFSFIWQVSEHLRKKGFEYFPPIQQTNEGKGWVPDHQRGIWFAVPWLNGKKASYEKWEHIKAAVDLLVALRLAGQGFYPHNPYPGRIHLGRWPAYFKNRLHDLRNFQQQLQKKDRLSEFDRLYKHYLAYYIAQGEEAISRLEETDYYLYCQKEKTKGTFCHHDFAHHNLLLYQGKAHIIDFDYCLYDLHLHDFGSLVIRVMKKNRWKIRSAEKILNYYAELNGLTEAEQKILVAFWQYPQDFWQLGFSYYIEQLPRTEREFIKRLKTVLKQEKERLNFLKEMKKAAQI